MLIDFQGKIEIELEVVSESEALSNPVGLGRSGPNKLSPPK